MVDHVKDYLNARLLFLEKIRTSISEGDPFLNTARLEENATDDEAIELVGHTNLGMVEDEVLDEITQIKKALAKFESGQYGICEDCGGKINMNRLAIEPEATLCTDCKRKRE